MTVVGLSVLKAWRSARLLSLEALAIQSGLDAAAILAIETGDKDFTGAELQALAGVLNCTPSGLLNGPSSPSIDAGAFERRLLAQMLRDVCVEAVNTFDDMGRLEDLKIAADADEFWMAVAALFSEAVRSVRQAQALDAPFAPLGTTLPAS